MKQERVPQLNGVAPLFIGQTNAEALIGRDWRWCRDTAAALGVRLVHVRRKLLIPASEFVDALMAADIDTTSTPEPDAPAASAPMLDSADSVLAALGKRRRSA